MKTDTMKTTLFTLIILFNLSFAIGQIKKPQYKDCEVCSAWSVHKGKKDHGQKYCVGYSTVRKYQNGKIDTISWSSAGETWIGDTYEMYKKLSPRGKYIIDSLNEDGIPHLEQSYLTYEPMYMKPGIKTESFWDIDGLTVVILKYKIYHSKKGSGVELISESVLK